MSIDSIAASVLSNLLGDYVTGINKSDLNISLLKGEVHKSFFLSSGLMN
jgi:hypothetical protein